MSNTAVIIADMGILVAIFMAGLLAKLFPRKRNRRQAVSRKLGNYIWQTSFPLNNSFLVERTGNRMIAKLFYNRHCSTGVDRASGHRCPALRKAGPNEALIVYGFRGAEGD